jgi:putative salt-induced outer membrane protein YdiY
LKACSLLAACCITFSAHAIVSMEDIHLGKPPEGFSGAFELSLGLETGNTENAGAATGLKFQWSKGNATDFFLANYAYGESAGIKDKNKGFMHFRHIQQLAPRYAWEAFTQVSFDEFTKLNLRTLLGGGARLTLEAPSDRRVTHLGLGAFYEHEKLDIDETEDDDTQNTLRGNAYLVFKYQFNDYVSLVSTTYYQPDLGDFADYRAILDLTVVSKFSEDMALQVGLDVAHDSEPLPEVEKTDTSLNVGVVFNF